MVKHYKVHISDVMRYKSCRQAWQWSSPLKSNLTPKDKYAPFFTGSLVHHCLEMKHTIGLPTSQAIKMFLDQECTPEQKQDQTILDQVQLVYGLMQHYDLWQKQDTSWLADSNFEFIANEQDFATIIQRNSRSIIELVGRFDGVVKSLTNGKYYLWEIKTTRSIAEREKQLALDSQADAYTNAATRMLGVPIEGIVYTLIRKKIPDFPKVLQNGNLSAATSQDITAYYYLDCIKRHHSEVLDSLDLVATKAFIKSMYGNTLEALLNNDKPYFKRVLVQRSATELANSWNELKLVSREMISKRTPIYLNESYGCNYCLFRNPCIAKRAGKNYQEILDRDYVYNQRYADEIEA